MKLSFFVIRSHVFSCMPAQLPVGNSRGRILFRPGIAQRGALGLRHPYAAL